LIASEALKRHTRPAHEALDASLGALISADADHGIEVLLRAALDVVPAWEARLRSVAWPSTLDAARRLGKTEWLDQDLGESAGGAEGAEALEPPEAWGALYVFEGSTLGSAVIRRISSHRARHSRYLAGYGDETAAMWTRFKEHLDRELSGQQDVTQAAAAARRIFSEFSAAVERHGRSRPEYDRRPDQLRS
jgi:heme oxygenase